MHKPCSTLLLVNNYWTRYSPKKWVETKPVCTHKYIYTHVFRDVNITFCLIPFFSHQHVLHRKPADIAQLMGLEERDYRKPRGHPMLSGGLERWAKASPAPWKNFNGNQFHLMGFQSLSYKLMSSQQSPVFPPGQDSSNALSSEDLWDKGNTQVAWDHFDPKAQIPRTAHGRREKGRNFSSFWLSNGILDLACSS